MKKTIFALLAASALLAGCRSGARKDVYFRSRLPTMEIPAFREGPGFGARVDVETVRSTVHATNNLVTDFNYYKDKINFSDSDSISGWDLFLTYKNSYAQIPLEVAATLDGLEARAGVFGFQEASDQKWFLMANYGIYRVAAYSESGNKCDFLCFDSQESSDSSEKSQNDLDVTMNGYESKLGATLGYRLDEKSSALVSYNRMVHNYNSSARKISTDARIGFSERAESYGLGVGYMYTVNTNLAWGFSADRILMTWNGKDSERYSFGLRTMVGF